jgi:hypothetical protein
MQFTTNKMEKLAAYTGLPLEWLQPKSLERTFELKSGEALLGVLSFRSAFGTLATAETADGVWTFKRVGFLNPRVTMRPAGSEADAAVYTPKFFGGGTLQIMGGPAIEWKAANFWATEWVFAGPDEGSLLRFTSGREKGTFSDIFKTQAVVHVEPAASKSPWLAMLTALGMYLLILHTEDSAATVAATTAAGAV